MGTVVIKIRCLIILTIIKQLLSMVIHWVLVLLSMIEVVHFFVILEMSKLRSVLVFIHLILEREGWRFDIIA